MDRNNWSVTNPLRIHHSHPTLNSQAHRTPGAHPGVLAHPNISLVLWNLSAAKKNDFSKFYRNRLARWKNLNDWCALTIHLQWQNSHFTIIILTTTTQCVTLALANSKIDSFLLLPPAPPPRPRPPPRPLPAPLDLPAELMLMSSVISSLVYLARFVEATTASCTLSLERGG